MPSVLFNSLPADARVWIFGTCQPVVGQDAERLLEIAEEFVHGWTAHGQPVVGSCDWRYDHFLLIAADERATGVSGCSIDSLYRALRQAEDELGITLLDSSRVWYRAEGGHVDAATRAEFRELSESGAVGPRTIVFDNTVTTVGQVEGGEWERPMAESWHGRAFRASRGVKNLELRIEN